MQPACCIIGQLHLADNDMATVRMPVPRLGDFISKVPIPSRWPHCCTGSSTANQSVLTDFDGAHGDHGGEPAWARTRPERRYLKAGGFALETFITDD